MLNFGQLRSMTIPEGNVIEIYDDGGALIWRRPPETVTITYGDNIPVTVKYHENFIGNSNTVTFLGRNLDVLKVQHVAYGKDALPPTPPHVSGFRFIGWSKSYTAVDADRVITAIYEEAEHIIITVILDSNERIPIEVILDSDNAIALAISKFLAARGGISHG